MNVYMITCENNTKRTSLCKVSPHKNFKFTWILENILSGFLPNIEEYEDGYYHFKVPTGWGEVIFGVIDNYKAEMAGFKYKIFNCEDDDSAKLYYEIMKGELL